MNANRYLCSLFFVVSILQQIAYTQDVPSPSDAPTDEKKENNSASDNKPEEISLSGIFEARNVAAISIDAKEWTTFKVESIVEHGQSIQKGDVLIRFETEAYDKAVHEAEVALKTATWALEDARLAYALEKQRTEIALKAAKDADERAVKDLKDWVTRGKSRRMESNERSLKRAKNSLEYQEEELRQLEKMYKADDLTEDTEEIILKRTRNTVESAKFSYELAQDSHRKMKEVTIPQTEETLKTAVKNAAITLRQTQETTPRKLQQQEIKLKQQEIELEEQKKKLKRLRSDRKFLEVRSPRNGIVYYGVATRGKWPAVSTLATSLKVGGSAKTKTGILSVVDPNSVQLRVSAPESSIRHLHLNKKVSVESVAYLDEKLQGKVSHVSRIPISEGNFDCILAVELKQLKGKVLPGMKGSAKLETSK